MEMLVTCCFLVLTVASAARRVGVEEQVGGSASGLLETQQQATFVEAGGIGLFSWNLACFEKAEPPVIAERILTYAPHIIGTLEDIEYNASSQGKRLQIPGYEMVASCLGEALWDTMPEYPKGGRYIQNAIYIHTSTVTAVRWWSFNTSEEHVVGDNMRCAVVADLVVGNWTAENPLRVAATHLSGGRFQDENWRDYEGQKGYEIRSVLDYKPDIVMGDLNSYSTAEQAAHFQQSYEPYLEAVRKKETDRYLAWATGGTSELMVTGFAALPIDDSTAARGGVVDHIYWHKQTSCLTCHTVFTAGNFTLSDHKAVGISCDCQMETDEEAP